MSLAGADDTPRAVPAPEPGLPWTSRRPAPGELRFEALSEAQPGPKWVSVVERTWPAYTEWYLAEGDAARPSYVECRRALARHMPELIPLWQRLTELAGGSDLAARLLSLYCPPPHATGCSQAIWPAGAGSGPPALVRNYDYHPAACEGVLLRSDWDGTAVLAMGDCLWGVLDGLNEHGLAVSLSFGGRSASGPGFGIQLILRYVLQTCRHLDEAVAVLSRVPSHMTYSITLLDAAGRGATVWVAPDRPPARSPVDLAANHQAGVEWPEHAAATGSVVREQALAAGLAAADTGLDGFVQRFLEPPLFSHQYARGFGTLYTAVYRPELGAVRYRWPGLTWEQTLHDFREGEVLIRFAAPPT